MISRCYCAMCMVCEFICYCYFGLNIVGSRCYAGWFETCTGVETVIIIVQNIALEIGRHNLHCIGVALFSAWRVASSRCLRALYCHFSAARIFIMETDTVLSPNPPRFKGDRTSLVSICLREGAFDKNASPDRKRFPATIPMNVAIVACRH